MFQACLIVSRISIYTCYCGNVPVRFRINCPALLFGKGNGVKEREREDNFVKGTIWTHRTVNGTMYTIERRRTQSQVKDRCFSILCVASGNTSDDLPGVGYRCHGNWELILPPRSGPVSDVLHIFDNRCCFASYTLTWKFATFNNIIIIKIRYSSLSYKHILCIAFDK